MWKALPILLRLAALAGVAAIAGALSLGYLGWVHPAFDSFSHFRIHLAVLLLVAILPLAVLRFWPEAIFAMVLGIGAIGSTLDFAERGTSIAEIDARATPVFRLFHLNLRFDNERPDLVLSAIGAHRPDVITFTEASTGWSEWLKVLEGAYPYQVICPPPSRIGGVAILSRRPFLSDSDEACSDRGSFARIDIDFAGRPASVLAMHLGWPWPFGQQSHFDSIAQDLADLPDAAMLAGDFNAVPWSDTVRQVAEMGRFQVLRGIGPTWLDQSLPNSWRPWIGLPIDHVMVKNGIVVKSARALDAVGSDHLPVLVEFSVEAEPPSQSVEFALRH